MIFKTFARLIFLFGMAGGALAPFAHSEEPVAEPLQPQPQQASEEESQAVIDERNLLEEQGMNDNGPVGMDAAHRLWAHYRAKGNLEKAQFWQSRFFAILEARAKEGDVQAIMHLATLYAKGNDLFPQDLVKARSWFEKAAEAGDATAQYQLATFYLSGAGGGKDREKASKWFRSALGIMMAKAKYKDATAAFWVGQMYFQGLGVDVDYKVAYDYFKMAAEQGELRAQIMLAFMYREGKGCEASETEAFKWFTKAAEQNDVGAIMEVAQAYREGKGVEKDSAKAKEWLLKGINLKDRYAVRTMAVMLENGEGGEKDETRALEYYEQAASLGDIYSTIQATRLLKASDPEKAYQLVSRATNEFKSPAAAYELALLEEKRGDSAMAAKLLQQSAESGYTSAMTKLGKLHLIPFSEVKWNPRISYYWWSIAEKNGDELAASNKKWLIWGGGSAVLVILVAGLLLLNSFIRKRLREQGEIS